MGALKHKLKKMYYDASLVKKINIANIIIIVIPILLLAFIANKVSSNIIIEKTLNNSVQSSRLVTQALDGLWRNTEHTANSLIANESIQSILNQVKGSDYLENLNSRKLMRVLMDNVIEPRDQASSAVIYQDHNYFVGSTAVNDIHITDQMKDKDLNNQFSELTKANIEGRWSDLHKIQYELKDNTNTISFKKNIIGFFNGDILGTLTININEEIISKSYSQLQYGKGGRFFIVNGEGLIVSSQNKDELFDNIGHENYFAWAQNKDQKGEIFTVKSKKYLVTSNHFEKMDWIVMGIIPMDELTADNRRVSLIIYLAGLVCVALAILSSIIISRTISNPLVKLSRSMKKVGLGNFDINIIARGNDEVGLLSSRFNMMIRQISELMDQVYLEQKKKSQYEFAALQAQIHPHFLFNTLESICSLVQMKRNDEAFQMVKALAKFYRMVLGMRKEIVSLKDEIYIAEQYLFIQKFRYADKFDFEIEVDPALLMNQVIKLSIQPLIENCLYHGLRNTRKKGKISIRGFLEEDKAIISVMDDGVGMSSADIESIMSNDEALSGKRSFGIQSVNERIKLIFGLSYGIQIISSIGLGTRVDIILPVMLNVEEDNL